MNKPDKCKNCQWYGKPYWSIINPCDNCSNENDNITTITIGDIKLIQECLTEEEIKKAMTDKSIFEITLEEKDKEIENLTNIINKLEKLIQDDHDECKNIGDSWERAVTIYTKSLLDELKKLKEQTNEK